MKKFLSIVLVMLSVQVFAQTNPITAINITLPTNPDANTANWGTGTSVFVISATSQGVNGRVNPHVEESKILVIIKQNGKTVCGAYTSSTAPEAGFSTLTKVWSGGSAASFLGKDCTLAPGDYELSVQFFGYGVGKTVALSDEKIKPFTIRGNDQQAMQPPQLILPADGTVFSETDIKKPTTFRWTPVIPKPQEPVTYRLRVWQLTEGQTGPQAIKANQPILTKDVDNLTQAVVPNLINGPCQPPYLCSFVWNVQALGRDGKPVGGNNGTSNTNKFDFASPCSPDYQLVFDKVACGDDGLVHVSGHVAINPKPGISITQIKLTSLKQNNYAGADVGTNITLPTALAASGNNYNFSFIVTDNLCNKKLFVGYTINSTCSSTGLNSATPCADSVTMPCCTCTFCDQYKDWGFEKQEVTYSSSAPYTVTVNATISAPNIVIKSFKAELVSFIHNGAEACFGCNKDSQTFGNFTGGTFGSWGNGVFPLAGVNTTHHTLNWFLASGATTNLSGSAISISFTAPPISPLACCDDEIDFCIRYSFTDADCRTCSFVKCYSIQRKHTNN